MSLLDYAKKEMKLAGWMEEDTDPMQKEVVKDVLELLEVFSSQHHSNFSGNYVLSLFKGLANFRPILPLTGKEEEWNEYGQNKRCFTVFKDEEGRAYNSNGRVFKNESGVFYTSRDSKVYIEFPWEWTEPEIVEVQDEYDRECKGKPV